MGTGFEPATARPPAGCARRLLSLLPFGFAGISSSEFLPVSLNLLPVLFPTVLELRSRYADARYRRERPSRRGCPPRAGDRPERLSCRAPAGAAADAGSSVGSWLLPASGGASARRRSAPCAMLVHGGRAGLADAQCAHPPPLAGRALLGDQRCEWSAANATCHRRLLEPAGFEVTRGVSKPLEPATPVSKMDTTIVAQGHRPAPAALRWRRSCPRRSSSARIFRRPPDSVVRLGPA
jgi:hypothetical protein